MDTTKPWGKSASIDLSGCEHSRLVDADILTQFVGEAIKVVGMEPHGPCYVERFGEGDIEGLSAMQFIETSTITVHLDEVGNRAFIDIFSCQDFDAESAAKFSADYFGATGVRTTVLER